MSVTAGPPAGNALFQETAVLSLDHMHSIVVGSKAGRGTVKHFLDSRGSQ